MLNPEKWISELGLEKHTEGGYYKEYYRKENEIDTPNGKRNLLTSIYYLLKGDEVSSLHKLKSDEIWYFHYGCSLNIYTLDESGKLEEHKLSSNIFHGEKPHLVIEAGKWFCAKPSNPFSFTLVSCAVAPGFDFKDFELAESNRMIKEFPQHKEFINEFCSK